MADKWLQEFAYGMWSAAFQGITIAIKEVIMVILFKKSCALLMPASAFYKHPLNNTYECKSSYKKKGLPQIMICGLEM